MCKTGFFVSLSWFIIFFIKLIAITITAMGRRRTRLEIIYHKFLLIKAEIMEFLKKKNSSCHVEYANTQFVLLLFFIFFTFRVIIQKHVAPSIVTYLKVYRIFEESCENYQTLHVLSIFFITLRKSFHLQVKSKTILILLGKTL